MGKKYVQPEGTRHILLPKDIIEGNIDKSKMRDDVKQSLISLSKRLKSITPEQFKMLSQKPELRDTFICLRWLAYSVGIFSNEYIDPNTNYKKVKKERLMMELKIMYFVHGTTVDNAAGKCSGWKQVELTDLGRERAIKLGEIQKDAGFDVIFTSDLIRAINSAKLAFPNVKHIQDKRLRECNYGDLDGQDKSLAIYEEHIEKPFPNGESLKDVERRIDDFIKFLKDNYHGKKVGIVAHRAPQLAFEVLTKKISWEEANRNDWRKAKAWQPGWEYIIK